MKKQHLFVSVILVFLIIVFSWFILSNSLQVHEFEFESNDVLFFSDDMHPGEFLSEAAQKDNFVVSPEYYESGSTFFMTQGLTLFNSVLIAQGKQVETLARVVSVDKVLLYCQSNEGDTRENNRIEASECMGRLSQTEKTFFLIDLPNSSLNKPTVEVAANKLIVTPKTYEDVSRVSFLVLITMFPDAQATIDLINGIVSNVEN